MWREGLPSRSYEQLPIHDEDGTIDMVFKFPPPEKFPPAAGVGRIAFLNKDVLLHYDYLGELIRFRHARRLAYNRVVKKFNSQMKDFMLDKTLYCISEATESIESAVHKIKNLSAEMDAVGGPESFYIPDQLKAYIGDPRKECRVASRSLAYLADPPYYIDEVYDAAPGENNLYGFFAFCVNRFKYHATCGNDEMIQEIQDMVGSCYSSLSAIRIASMPALLRHAIDGVLSGRVVSETIFSSDTEEKVRQEEEVSQEFKQQEQLEAQNQKSMKEAGQKKRKSSEGQEKLEEKDKTAKQRNPDKKHKDQSKNRPMVPAEHMSFYGNEVAEKIMTGHTTLKEVEPHDKGMKVFVKEGGRRSIRNDEGQEQQQQQLKKRQGEVKAVKLRKEDKEKAKIQDRTQNCPSLKDVATKAMMSHSTHDNRVQVCDEEDKCDYDDDDDDCYDDDDPYSDDSNAAENPQYDYPEEPSEDEADDDDDPSGDGLSEGEADDDDDPSGDGPSEDEADDDDDPSGDGQF